MNPERPAEWSRSEKVRVIGLIILAACHQRTAGLRENSPDAMAQPAPEERVPAQLDARRHQPAAADRDGHSFSNTRTGR
jgi:hypothetical protein